MIIAEQFLLSYISIGAGTISNGMERQRNALSTTMKNYKVAIRMMMFNSFSFAGSDGIFGTRNHRTSSTQNQLAALILLDHIYCWAHPRYAFSVIYLFYCVNLKRK